MNSSTGSKGRNSGRNAVPIDEGLDASVGPLSTIAGVTLINAVVVRAVERLVAAGRVPDVFSNANLAAERPVDPAVLQRARSRVRAL